MRNFLVFCCLPLLVAADAQISRLRVTNGCNSTMWLQHIVGVGCGSLPDPKFLSVAPGEYHDYTIPDEGLCGFRVWPLFFCGAEGKALGLSGDEQDCEVGSSGGNDYCPPDIVNIDGRVGGIGCGPPIDTKFEGTFGCTLSGPGGCRVTPQGQSLFGRPDSWDTSLVDGWTVPFAVDVLDDCSATGPVDNRIDCSDLTPAHCPTTEDLSAGDASLRNVSLLATHPVTGRAMGCKSPCSRLSKGQWFSLPSPPFNNVTYPEDSGQARWYCCPQSVTPDECRAGPIIGTKYVDVVHQYCPQTYAYSYDETAKSGALWSCAAGTRYHVTFLCPAGSNERSPVVSRRAIKAALVPEDN